MIRPIIVVVAAAFFSVAIAFATGVCDNAPCENAINVSRGDNFTISLESNTGSTGFDWWTQFDTEYLILVESAARAGEHPAGMVGVPGERLFTFNARKAGSTEVIMLLLRPWENGTIAARKIYPVSII
jgi:predicted secreted protein